MITILFNLGQCIGACHIIATFAEKERKQECEENPFLSKLIHLFATQRFDRRYSLRELGRYIYREK